MLIESLEYFEFVFADRQIFCIGSPWGPSLYMQTLAPVSLKTHEFSLITKVVEGH
jgi:hypothetical protein